MAGGFTRRASVYDQMPYRGFTDLELLIVEKALRLAWDEAPKRFHCHQITFASASEDEISSALVMVFDNIWAFDRTLLEGLAKTLQPLPEFNSHHGSVNYLGRALSFRPDLTFRRVYTPPGMSALNGCLFVEAKVLGRKRTIGMYCGDGVARFVDGTYAWAVPQAIMIGYVHGANQKLPDALAKHFRRKGKSEAFKLQDGPTAFPLSPSRDKSHATIHDRDWTYPGTTASPGPIKLLHLWLAVLPERNQLVHASD